MKNKYSEIILYVLSVSIGIGLGYLASKSDIVFYIVISFSVLILTILIIHILRNIFANSNKWYNLIISKVKKLFGK